MARLKLESIYQCFSVLFGGVGLFKLFTDSAEFGAGFGSYCLGKFQFLLKKLF